MIIVLKADTVVDSPEVRRVIELAESFPGVSTEFHQIQGATRSLSELYLLGSTGVIPTEPFAEFACVEKVVRITEKFRAIGRHEDGLLAVGFEYNGLHIGQDTFHLFPGLCAVDTAQNVETMFRMLAEFGIQTARAGVYKPRTSPYDFQGLGAECLPMIFELAGKYDIRILSMEVTHESHIDEILEALGHSGHA
ncbi:MAG: 3-deoxy-7-phosphoheptulonate synthase, partial [Myxococcota bacterium]